MLVDQDLLLRRLVLLLGLLLRDDHVLLGLLPGLLGFLVVALLPILFV